MSGKPIERIMRTARQRWHDLASRRSTPTQTSAPVAQPAKTSSTETVTAATPAAPGYEDLTAVWDAAPNEDYRRDQSHWRGEGRWESERWAAIGKNSRSLIAAAAATLGRDMPSGPMLEWGPGGGTNLFAFAEVSSRLYGVDVSPRNLGESARVLAELDPAPRFTQIIVGEDPTTIAAEVDEPIDTFISTAVFQHFPNRDYGATVLRTVASVLAPNALGCIQIRYDDNTAKYRPKTGDYRRNHITFTSYPIDDFWDLLVASGLRPLAVNAIDSTINYATFTFTRD